MLKHRNVGCPKEKTSFDYKHVHDPAFVYVHNGKQWKTHHHEDGNDPPEIPPSSVTSEAGRETMRNSG